MALVKRDAEGFWLATKLAEIAENNREKAVISRLNIHFLFQICY